MEQISVRDLIISESLLLCIFPFFFSLLLLNIIRSQKQLAELKRFFSSL